MNPESSYGLPHSLVRFSASAYRAGSQKGRTMSRSQANSMIAVKINPLREFHYATWDDLGNELGFAGAKLIHNHRRREVKKRCKPSGLLVDSVNDLFEQKFPFPLVNYQQLIRDRLTVAKREPGSKKLLDVIREIVGIVGDANPTRPLNAAGLKYIHYLALHAHAVLNKKNSQFGCSIVWRESLARSIVVLEEGRAIISSALDHANDVSDVDELKELDTWMFLNWVVAVGSHVPGDAPPDPVELAETFRRCEALEKFHDALVCLPHEWRIPYNGLDVASRLHASDADLQKFFSRLCDFDVGFTDFDYTPGEVPSIANNPGLEFFRQRCQLNPDITTQSRKVLPS